jgi:hypothetical protein
VPRELKVEPIAEIDNVFSALSAAQFDPLVRLAALVVGPSGGSSVERLVLAQEPAGDLSRVEPEEMTPLDERDARLRHESANMADGDTEVSGRPMPYPELVAWLAEYAPFERSKNTAG